MANPHIKEPETQRPLKDLNPNKGAGPDGLFPNTLTTLNPNIAPVLYAFLTSPSKLPRSLTTGARPSLPQLQKHSTQQTQTYSGPSVCRLLFAKCFELFSKRTCFHICPNFSLLMSWQHDSLPRRETLPNLQVAEELNTKWLDEGSAVDLHTRGMAARWHST